MTVLFDTNVLLDVLAQRDPFHKSASRMWALAEHRLIRGLVSATSINDVYYVLRRHAGREKAQEGIQLVATVFEIAAIDHACVQQALGPSTMKDFEDRLQVAAASASGSDFIVTRNVTDFAGAPVPAVSPDALLAIVANQSAPPPPTP